MDEGERIGKPPRIPLIQREVALLVALCVVATGLFFATRAMAHWSRGLVMANAAAWFERGQASLARGDAAEALADFRKAAAGNRNAAAYELALARTLANGGELDEATQILLNLRETNPDGIEVNYRLARVAVKQHRTDDAIGYYNHALYGIARGGVPIERYRIRMELVDLLLDTASPDAPDELNVLVRELPDTADAHMAGAALAARVPNRPLALAASTKAAALAAHDPAPALAAGRLAVTLGDFDAAARMLARARAAGAPDTDLPDLIAVVREAAELDPFADRITPGQRTARIAAGIDLALEELAACPELAESAAARSNARTGLVALRRRLRQVAPDAPATRTIVSTIDDALALAARCHPPSNRGRAWALASKVRAEKGP
jgi:tetratricopeptide (TPR) repeat protein